MPEKSFISRKNYHSCLARHKNYSPLPLPAKLLLLQNFPRNFQEHKSLFFIQVSTKSSKHARPRERDEILVSAGEIWPIYTIYITRLSDNVSHFFCSDKKQQENRRRNLSLAASVCCHAGRSKFFAQTRTCIKFNIFRCIPLWPAAHFILTHSPITLADCNQYLLYRSEY